MENKNYRKYSIFGFVLLSISFVLLVPAFLHSEALGCAVLCLCFACGIFAAVMRKKQKAIEEAERAASVRKMDEKQFAHASDVSRAAFEAAAAAEAAKPKKHFENISFDVENVTFYNKDGADRQVILKRLYKESQKDDFIFVKPECNLYPRGTKEEPEYVVYIGSDRIGEAPEEKSVELLALSTDESARLVSVDYNIEQSGYDADIDDLRYDCEITVIYEITEK